METVTARQEGEYFFCTAEGCTKGYTRINSLRKHAEDVHKSLFRTEKAPVDAAVRREQNRLASKRYREKRKAERITEDKLQQRRLFKYKTAERRGGHMNENALLEVRVSQIPHAGNGVYALCDLRKDDVVTWYDGEKLRVPPADTAYTIQVARGYIDGARTLRRGVGLGSFINRTQREFRCWKNCEFVRCSERKHQIYIVITKRVAVGEELYLTYGRSYRMNYSET